MHKTFFKEPQPVNKAERRRKIRDWERQENCKQCYLLDRYRCRNPFGECSQFTLKKGIDALIRESHHILGRSNDNRYDGVEYRITLCRKCHETFDKDRKGMLKILRELKRTAPDFRWQKPLELLERKIGEAV